MEFDSASIATSTTTYNLNFMHSGYELFSVITYKIGILTYKIKIFI